MVIVSTFSDSGRAWTLVSLIPGSTCLKPEVNVDCSATAVISSFVLTERLDCGEDSSLPDCRGLNWGEGVNKPCQRLGIESSKCESPLPQ